MSVSYENSKVVFQGIKDAGITSLSALPETWLGLLLQQAEKDPDITLIQVAKEEEAIGIAAGAYFAGERHVLLMQNHGFLAAINGIVSLAMLYGIPLCMLIALRGHWGETYPWHTHFAAPIHWITGRDLPNSACDTISVSRFVGPACVIDVTAEVSRDPDFLLTPERLEQWEGEHGRTPRRAWVLLRSGWSRRTDAESLINARDDGPHSPGFDARTSTVLAEHRDVLGVGVETIGTDAGQAGTFIQPFPNHATMHGAGKFGLASLCNLDQLPPTGAVVIAAPLRIVNGSGSPLRVIAIAPA